MSLQIILAALSDLEQSPDYGLDLTFIDNKTGKTVTLASKLVTDLNKNHGPAALQELETMIKEELNVQ